MNPTMWNDQCNDNRNIYLTPSCHLFTKLIFINQELIYSNQEKKLNFKIKPCDKKPQVLKIHLSTLLCHF